MPSFTLQQILKSKILAAVTFEDAEQALAVAEVFLNAGLHVMEIPFRTPVAAKVVEAIQKNFPEMFVGAGTLLTKQQLQQAIDAGAKFGLSPGCNLTVAHEAKRQNFHFIPGVMTPSEIEQACGLGLNILKLFPAEQLGGTGFLKAMLAPYEQLNVQFIPMGGVNINNMTDYLQLANVIAVGGSWLATKQLLASKDYATIKKNIVAAMEVANASNV